MTWIGVALLTAYLVFIGGGWFGIYYPSLRIVTVSLTAVVLVVWMCVAWRTPTWRPRSVLLPALAGCLGSLAVSSVFSRFPRVSFEYLAYAILLAAVYLLLVRLLADPFFRVRFVALARILFVIVAGAFIVRSAAHWITWWGVVGRITTPPLRPEFESLVFGNPSTVLTMVAMLAVPVVASTSWNSRRGAVIVVATLSATAAVALISGSRAGWLALAIAAAAAGVAVLAVPAPRALINASLRQVLTGSRGWLVALAAAGIGLAVLAVAAPSILRRAAEGGEEIRGGFVRIALDLFSQSPIVGTGPGSWVIQRIALTEPTDVDYYIPHAHNIYAQTLAELGVVGAIAGLFLGISVLVLLRRAARAEDLVRRRWAWATSIGLIYFGAHQLLDFYANMPAVLFAAAIPIAYLDATSPQTERLPLLGQGRAFFRMTGVASVMAAVVVLATVAGLLWQEVPASSNDVAVSRANIGDWSGADAPARAAAATDPAISPYLFTAGLAASHSGDHAAAAAYFAEVAARDDLPEAWLDLAAEQAELGQTPDALRSVTSALRLGIQRPAVAMPAGDLALRLGDDDLATQAFIRAISTAPSLAADPWWSADEARTRILQEVAESIVGSTLPLRWEVALMIGDRERAASAALDPASGDLGPDVVKAWTGDAGALARLLGRCEADPLDLGALLWCARLEGHLGHLDQANDFRYLADTLNGGAFAAGAELRVNPGRAVGRSLQGGPASFWGTYTYRRSTPWDILVPSLIHLTIE
jgi:tetratricopeptide (TPR) repeat protein